MRKCRAALMLGLISFAPINHAQTTHLQELLEKNHADNEFRSMAAASLLIFSAACLTTSMLLATATYNNQCPNAPLTTTAFGYGASCTLLIGGTTSSYVALRLLSNSPNTFYTDLNDLYRQIRANRS